MSLYADLGVSDDASDEEIRKAYIKKARESHPDAGGDEDEFKRVSRAYAVLSDGKKREHYDRTGETEGKSVEKAAHEMLANLFYETVLHPQFEPGLSDLIDILRSVVTKKKKQAEKKKKITEKNIKKIEKTKKRIKAKEKQNVFLMFAEKQVEYLTNEVKEAQFMIDVGDEMLSIIENHEYEGDEGDEENPIFKFIKSGNLEGTE